ncbi:P68 family surface lipoprotein [Mesomycoplasma bovoculi]|uniref:Lipoprotein B-2 n=1 Tax=Mesomycoplasma bovoculi M165/69 TaxID=743966 RepID=W5UTE6_9BACT|nr:hypothetical protein [Mesomycoplasma bovoculi]AHH45396.1 Lipoprotein B-2 [Mesomycoplasma bovoculi M165/69]
MKLKKILSILPILATTTILVACGTVSAQDPKIEQKNETPTILNKEVKFATSQGKFWPLIYALDAKGEHKTGLIPYYNQTFKNDEDFVPVRLQLNEETKAETQLETANNLTKAFSTNSKSFPSIILGDVTSAIAANQHNRLLDLSTTKLNPNLFKKSIVENYNKLNLGNNKLFNIPFDIKDVDAIGFNLDNIAIIFDLIKQGGGSVDESMDIYQKAIDSKDKGNSVPKNSLFRAIKAKTNHIFAGLTINKETFTTIESALGFANKFVDGIEIDSSKIENLDNETDNISIFDIDYADQSFIKDIISNTGKALWDIKTKNGKTSFEFPINLDSQLQNEFKLAYDKFTKEIKQVKIQVNGKEKIIQAIQFKNYKKKGGFGEWGSHDILLYRTAFGYMPGISMDGEKSRFLFPKQVTKFATYQDVYAIGQALKSIPNSTYLAYWSGGSSLIPIKSDDKIINKGTIKFLEWLFTGDNTITGKKMSNLDYIAKVGAYFVPTKEYVSEIKLNELIKERDALLTQIKEEEKTTGPTFKLQGDDAKNINWQLYTTLGNLNATILSMQSMLDALKQTSDKKIKLLFDSSDLKASKIATTIGDSLIERTDFEKPTIKTSEQILSSIKGIVDSD